MSEPQSMELIGYLLHEYRPYGAPGETARRGIWIEEYRREDGTISGDFEDVVEYLRSKETTISLTPLYAEKKS